MRFYHPIFDPLHFDYGTTQWSVRHVPLFSCILSALDHRRLGLIHNVTFYALMRVLTNGKITQEQAQCIFDHLDLTMTGDLSYSELAFMISLIVAHKDNLEREFFYMNTWKIWVIFNEHGHDRLTTREFRRTGLLFDFNYPTMYSMFRDYDWDDEKPLEFERFRFYLISCIHIRQSKRFQARYLRFRQFRRAVLLLLQRILKGVLMYEIYPSPTTILQAIYAIKIPPIEGTERSKGWADLFEFSDIRHKISKRWELTKAWWVTSTVKNSKWWGLISRIFCCDVWWAREENYYNWCRTCDIWCADEGCLSCLKKKRKKPKIYGEEGEGIRPLTHKELMGLVPTAEFKKAQQQEETEKKRRKKHAVLRDTQVQAVPEMEWKPLGKPRFTRGVQ